MFIYKRVIFILLLCCAFVALVLPHFYAATPKQPELIVGLQSSYPPFEFMDEKGEIVGFDIDLAKEIAIQLGKKIVFKDMEFEGLILALKQGKIDLIMSGMNITLSRMKEIHMVPYHGEQATHLSLIFWKSLPQGINSFEDLCKLNDISLSVESGTVSETFLDRYPQIIKKSFQGSLAPLMDVKWGKSLADLVEPAVAEYLKLQHPEIIVMNVPLSKEDEILGFGIGIKKNNEELIENVSSIIQKLKDSNKLIKLENSWFRGEKDE